MKIVQELHAPPSHPNLGDIYFDMTLERMRIYNGHSWGNLYANHYSETLKIQKQFDKDLKGILDEES